MVVRLEDLKKAHYTLMKEYVNILNQASKLPIFSSFKYEIRYFKRKKRKERTRRVLSRTEKLFVFGSLVMLFVESHIKGKLNELRVSYIQFSQALSVDEPSVDEYKTWLKQAEEELTEFADTLSPWGGMLRIGSIITFLSPFITGINLLAIFGGSNIQEQFGNVFNTPFLSVFLSSLVILIGYPFLFISSSFSYKRILFFIGSDFYGFFGFRKLQTNGTVTNVYDLEDRLFDLLEKRKIPESPLDIVLSHVLTMFPFIAIPVSILIFTIYILVIVTYGDYIYVKLFFIFLAILSNLLIYGLFCNSIIKGRKWR